MQFKRITSDSNQINLSIYCDANWGGDLTDRISTTGMIVQLCGNTVSWNSKKQKTVALSSTESEYMALSSACQESVWCQAWLVEVLGIDPSITVYSDNQSAIALTRSDSFHNRTKHIDIRHHFVKDLIRRNTINLEWVSTNDQLADIMTKSLPRAKVEELVSQLLIGVVKKQTKELRSD